MADTQVDDIVVFQNSLGEEISNDPRWHAKKTLEAAGYAFGVPFDASQPDHLNDQLRARVVAAADEDDIENDDEPDTDEAGARTYKELDGKGLKALAAERGVDITGLKKVGEVRAALIAADAAAADTQE